jgi:ubiquinone/menaquinone biosynthesis C-methylase UbiE
MTDQSATMKNKLMGLAADMMLMTSLRLGSELGLFEHLKKSPMTSDDLAEKAGISKRYAFEWCLHMASTKIIEHNPDGDTFHLPAAHAEHLLAGDGMFPMLCCLSDNHSKQYPMVKLAYQMDGGIFWGDMPSMAKSAKLFFKPVYEKLLPLWLDGNPSVKKHFSKEGASIADVGCGCGMSTISMAKLFPSSNFVGLDFHPDSIAEATENAKEAHVTNACFEVHNASAWVTQDHAEGKHDVVCMFDCFHDMSDPELIAGEVFKALKSGGVWLLIEPLSSEGDSIAERLTLPTAPVYTGFSAHFCTPCGKTVPGKEGLGTTAGTVRYKAIFEKAGFSDFENIGSSMEGPTSPTMMGFRLMIATK